MNQTHFFNVFLILFTIFGSAQSTASKHISKFTIEAPELDTQKTIWVYLPKDYQESKDDYSVVYMFDAQNLFDAESSFVGEWEIDEYLDKETSKAAIIVGIEHGNDKRIEELTPYPHPEYGGGNGDQFLGFIVHTLKPHIDLNYRTKPEAKDTFIIGSSLGGLMAFYALVKYPTVFNHAGVFSPAFWINPELFDLVSNSEINENLNIFFLAGTDESETMIPNIDKVTKILNTKGLTDDHWTLQTIERGQHNEALWREGFPNAFEWLFRGF